MNRKARRNKHKKETAKLNIEINRLTKEKEKYLDYWCTANCENAKLSVDLCNSKKETEKYKEKFYAELKKEFLDGRKELLTVSVNVPRDILPYPSSIDEKKLEQERRKYLCHEIAQYLYDNKQAFQVVEHETYTRYNLVLVQSNPNKNGISEEDFDDMMRRYGNNDICNSLMKGRTSSVRFNEMGAIDSPFVR